MTAAVARNDEPQRASLMRLIEEQPGLDLKELSDLMGLSRSTVVYHIRRLGSRVVTIRQGRYSLHFAASMPSTQRRAIALLRIWSVRFLVEQAIHDKAIEPALIAQEKGISKRSVRRSIRMLVEAGLARDHKDDLGRLRGVRHIDLHPDARLAWSLWCRDEDSAHQIEPLRKSPGWVLLLPPGLAFVLDAMMGRLFHQGTAS